MMTLKEKFLVLWLFVMVIVVFAVTHIAGHLASVVENCLAAISPMLNL
ncbi:MAG TPA: hypothetical protein VIH67_12730 [Candidatus Acidoferrum sp.]